MFCIKCGNKLEDNVKFCPSCGTKIEAKEEPKEEKIEETTEKVVEAKEEIKEEVKEEEKEEVKEEPVQPVQEVRREFNPPPVSQPVYNAPPKKGGSGVVVAILVILILLVIGGGTLILVGIGTGFIKIDVGQGEILTPPEPAEEQDPPKPEVHSALTVNWKGYSFSIPEEYDFESEDTYAAFGTSEILYQLSVHNLNYYEIKAAKENLLKTVQVSETETLVISKVDVDRHDGKEYIEAYGESNTLIYHYYITATDNTNEVVAIAVLYEKGTFTKSEVTPVITSVVGSLKRLSRDVEDSEGEVIETHDELSLLDDYEE